MQVYLVDFIINIVKYSFVLFHINFHKLPYFYFRQGNSTVQPKGLHNELSGCRLQKIEKSEVKYRCFDIKWCLIILIHTLPELTQNITFTIL